MLHYFKFRQDLFDPAPAKELYTKPGPGRGWPEECPPLRAANAFGWDVLANFDVTFRRKRDGTWVVEPDIVVTSDFDWAASDDAPGRPLVQQYAWFWEKGQKIPHVITDNVYRHIRNQVKLSTFLYLHTDPNEVLLLTGVPLGPRRPWRTMTALIETDWYAASYPWHAVLELDDRERTITIEKGEPICRLMPLRRDTYFAAQMTADAFDAFFERGQRWLAVHGRPVPTGEPETGDGRPAKGDGTLDITRTYVRQQMKSRFVVLE
ncbi:MAG: DUF6065 family protein [Tepidisphaerales bacterium]